MRKLDLTSSDKLYCKQTLDRILILIVGHSLSGYTPSLSFRSHGSTIKLDYMSKQQKMFLALICSIEHDWFISQPIAASNLLNKPIIKCFRSHSLPTSFVYPCRNFFLINLELFLLDSRVLDSTLSDQKTLIPLNSDNFLTISTDSAGHMLQYGLGELVLIIFISILMVTIYFFQFHIVVTHITCLNLTSYYRKSPPVLCKTHT